MPLRQLLLFFMCKWDKQHHVAEKSQAHQFWELSMVWNWIWVIQSQCTAPAPMSNSDPSNALTMNRGNNGLHTGMRKKVVTTHNIICYLEYATLIQLKSSHLQNTGTDKKLILCRNILLHIIKWHMPKKYRLKCTFESGFVLKYEKYSLLQKISVDVKHTVTCSCTVWLSGCVQRVAIVCMSVSETNSSL